MGAVFPIAPGPRMVGRSRLARWMNAGVALGALAVLAVARWLDPSPLGHATHTQLGLPGCSFLTVTGVPCPMCGATTTWSLLAHGRILEGVVNQPFGAFLFVVTVGVIGVAGAEAIQPRGRWKQLESGIRPVEPQVAIGILLAMMAGWIWKIATIA